MYRHKWKARRGSEPELHVHVHIYRTCACLQLVLPSVSSSLVIVIWVQTLVLTWNAALALSLLLSRSLTLYTQNTFYTYVYTSLIHNLVFGKFVAKHLGKNCCSITYCTGCILHGQIAIIMKLSSPFLVCDIVMVPGLLPIFLHGCEIKSASG